MRHIEYILIPLIEMGNLKLDYEGIEGAILDSNGFSTAAFRNFELFSFDSRFPEKDYKQTYDLCFELATKKHDRYFVIGQNGLFLKVDKKASFETVNHMISESKSFIEFCKAFLFKPVVVVHTRDGDFYMDEEDYWRYGSSYKNVEFIE